MKPKFNKVFEGTGKLVTGEEDTGIIYPISPPKEYMPTQLKTKAERKAWKEWQEYQNSGFSFHNMFPDDMYNRKIKYKITVEAEIVEE
jgi:hypothetical protein